MKTVVVDETREIIMLNSSFWPIKQQVLVIHEAIRDK